MSRPSKTSYERAPMKERAGTHITFLPENAVKFPVWDNHRKETLHITHGYVDYTHNVFQGGGHRTEIINYRMNPPHMSMMLEVWLTLLTKHPEIYVWEMIDHDSNTVYRIHFDKLRVLGVRYRTEKGKRFGVPLQYCDHIDSQGRILHAGDPIPPPPMLVFGETDPSAYIKRPRPKAKAKA
jgi:hypothetical protein